MLRELDRKTGANEVSQLLSVSLFVSCYSFNSNYGRGLL